MPKVSVIMPLYNAESFVEEAINSILNQTYGDFELVVVNDSSTDGSVKVVKKLQNKDSRIKLYCNNKNKGIAYTRNRAIALSSGEYIAIMDDDDVAPEYRLAKSVEYLDNHQDCMIVGGHFREIDAQGKDLYKEVHMFLNPDYIKAVFLLQNTIPNSSAMIRKDFIVRNQIMYKDNMYGAEDYRFWVECSIKGKIGTIDEVLLYWRNHKGNETSRVFQSDKKEREKVIADIQRYALRESGFVLTEEDYLILNKVYGEDGRAETMEELEDVYRVLQKIAMQAKQKGMQNAKEVVTMCRKRFGEKVGKAFFLWD